MMRGVVAAKRAKGGAAAVAASIVDGSAEQDLAHHIGELDSDNDGTATRAARVVDEVIKLAPELGAPHIERLVRFLSSERPRVVQTSASALPNLARVAPAKVARHLAKLRAHYDAGSEVARDGVVRTFVALCTASVAYQRRLIDVLERALGEADPKTLVSWAEAVLPALKGEPHAQARAVVEERLPALPRAEAQKLADFLGLKLRRA